MALTDTGFARSYLFVPATRLDRISKALTLGADEIIVDLEDAVAGEEKATARYRLSTYEADRPVFVRVNAADTEYFDSDVSFCEDTEWVKGIVLPMVSSAFDVQRLMKRLTKHTNILALIETPRGVLAAEEIAASGVTRLLFGTADYCASLNTPASAELFAYPRTRLVLASALAGLPAPIDGPTLQIHRSDELVAQSQSARAVGMGGKLCIHPSQLQVVADVFGPSDAQRDWARRVLAAAVDREGVFVLDGEMVDAPVLSRARWIAEQ
jgi:citrate lyase subunit beta/citryl-CoA lyase